MKWLNRTFIVFVLVFAMVLPVLTPVVSAAGTSNSGLKDYHSMSMDEILKSSENLTWVFAGDSITHNGSWTQGMNSYSEWFEQYLLIADREDDAVINTGWGGADIQDFLYYEDTPKGNGAKSDAGMGLEQFITKYNPDVVFVKLGMNNRAMSTEEFAKNYKLMLDGVYAEGEKNGKIPKIVLITPTPLVGETLLNQDRTDQASCWRFQKCLKQIAKEYDLLFVDLMTAFTTEGSRMGYSDYRYTFFSDPSDGAIHPNSAGHYLIYKTLSKVLGIYDESLTMYRLNYEEILKGYLWDNATDDLKFVGDYTSIDTEVDADEMDKTMPTLTNSNANLLASVDFSKSNGGFTYSNFVDLTDPQQAKNPLTLEEVQSMGKEFTVVFRARLDETVGRSNQPVLWIASKEGVNFNTAGNNVLMAGVPGTASPNVYYALYEGRTAQSSRAGSYDNIDILPELLYDGTWHTVALVQTFDKNTEAGTLHVYVDGVGFPIGGSSTLKKSIGELFAEATELDAAIGRYNSDNTSWRLQGNMDFWQLYDKALSVKEIGAISDCDTEIVTENNLWVVAGAEQLSGYHGFNVNRSLYRLIDNTMRNSGYTYRDIRTVMAAAPGYTVASLNANYESLIGRHNGQVLLLLPEVSQVYAKDYQHSSNLVGEYKTAVASLINKAKADGMICILWTPLASSDAVINAYIDDYAKAIREIIGEDSSIRFFDANGFMNDNMASNGVFAANWFEEDMYITPLCATDLAKAYYSCAAIPGFTYGELIAHNLRLNDDRTVRSNYVRDYIASDISVNGTKITVDVAPIMAKYSALSNVQIAVLPATGIGDLNSDIFFIEDLTAVSANGTKYTFEAPCSDPVLTVYGNVGEYIYRFKDLVVDVQTSAKLPGAPEAATPTDLTGLEVLGAGDIRFSADKTSYDLVLQQYNSYVQIVATAAEGQTITINGEGNLSGVRSQYIAANDGGKIEISVTFGGKTKTYTLNITRGEYPDIIITEVMTDGYGNQYDLIEIYNASGKDLNLLDYSVGYKKDYSYSTPADSENNPAFYFYGNETNFQSVNGARATKTGINEITKYSTIGPDGRKTQPSEVKFPANSTMVIWVKYGNNGNLSYETLIEALTENAELENFGNDRDYNFGNKTLIVNGNAVVPTEQQMVVAEIPNGAAGKAMSWDSTHTNFYLENHAAANDGSNTRTWLFLLNKGAAPDSGLQVTEAGDDIVSAGALYRMLGQECLSSVMYYDPARGMSVVKDMSIVPDAPVTGYTSENYGYMNLTSFGSIEYWQKPADSSDTKAPSAEVTLKNGKLTVKAADDTDVRYIEVHLDLNQDGIYETVSRCDVVLQTTAASQSGTAADQKTWTYTCDAGKTDRYYGIVVDGNGHETAFGEPPATGDDQPGNDPDDSTIGTTDGTTDGSKPGTDGNNENTQGTTGNTDGTTDSTEGTTDGTEGTTGNSGSNGNSGNSGSNGNSGNNGNAGTTAPEDTTGVGVQNAQNGGSPLKLILLIALIVVGVAIVGVFVFILLKAKKQKRTRRHRRPKQ